MKSKIVFMTIALAMFVPMLSFSQGVESALGTWATIGLMLFLVEIAAIFTFIFFHKSKSHTSRIVSISVSIIQIVVGLFFTSESGFNLRIPGAINLITGVIAGGFVILSMKKK